MTAFTAAHDAEVRNIGFSVVRGAFEPSLAAAWRESLANLTELQRASMTERSRIDDYMVHNPMVQDPVFFGLLEHPSTVAALDALLGPTSILYAFTTSSMPRGGTNYSNRIHVDCPRVIPGYISNIGIITALDDFNDENGATYFLPRSFERLDVPSEEEFFRDAVRVYPNTGDMVVFNARTYHLGGTNLTDRDRHALTINACRSYMRQRFDYPRLLPAGIEKTMSPTLRRVLGYDVRVPTSLEEYYLPEDQRLYKANQG